jgi:hypothetical protein
MAISSIHIENGKAGYFAHNSRESETINSIFSDEKNYCSCSKNEAFKIYRSELNKRKEVYVNNTKQRFQGKTVTHLSAILNFNKEHTQADIKKICDHLEKLLDTKVIQFSMHRDEGHTIEKGSEDIHSKLYETVDIKNYHAHIEFMGIDSKGKSLKQKIDKPFLKQLQTDTANILNMQRGQQSGYSKDEYKKIQEQLEPIASYPSKKAYNQAFNKVAKELEYMKARKKPVKRLDTYEYKEYAKKLGIKDKEIQEIKEKQTDINLAKQKDLKEEVSRLRAELQGKSAIREDYAKLEELNRDLKQQIKDKSLTVIDLQDKIKGLEIQFLQEKKEKEYFKSLVEVKKIEVEESLVLSKKINSNPIMNDYEHKINEYEKQLVDYEETFVKLDEILLTEDEKIQGKDYLTTSEVIERVSEVKNQNNWFKARFIELNKLLDKPLEIDKLLDKSLERYTDIFKAIYNKIRFGVEDTKNFINKLRDNAKDMNKTFNKQLSKEDTPRIEIEEENISISPFKRKNVSQNK